MSVDCGVVGPLFIVAEEDISIYGVGEGRVGEDCLISSVDDICLADCPLFAVVKMFKVDFDVVGPLLIVGEGRVGVDCLISSVNNIWSVDCTLFAVVKMFKVDIDVVGNEED